MMNLWCNTQYTLATLTFHLVGEVLIQNYQPL